MDSPVKIASSRKGDETTIFSPFLFSHSFSHQCTQEYHFNRSMCFVFKHSHKTKQLSIARLSLRKDNEVSDTMTS